MSTRPEVTAVAELHGITHDQAATALARMDAEFHPERLVRDISESLVAAERVEFQTRVRTAMTERPDVPIVEHILEAAVAIEAKRG